MRTAFTPVTTRAGAIERNRPVRQAYVSRWNTELQRAANEKHHLTLASLRGDEIEKAEHMLASHIRRTRRELARLPDVFKNRNAARRRRNPSRRKNS
jgi:DNA-binding GntR family transcriptional regulator